MAGIYVHIPFCVKKCAYCDFVSFEGSPHVRRYIDALKAEMKISALRLPYRSYDTVFVGGGTPSTLPLGAAEDIFCALKKHFDIAENAEITMECNPGTVDAEKLREYRNAGVNRLSFGLQSANDALLSAIARIHTFDDFLKSYALAREEGFCNINVDVMYGLPGQTERDLSQTLSAVLALSPEHISAYSLILEEGTPLYARVKRGEAAVPDEDEAFAQHRLAIETLQNNGYERYEISNYARRGGTGEKSPYRCKHNLNYWNNGEYLGLGLNAHSAMRLTGWTRWSNTESLEAYLSRVESGELPAGERQGIDRGEEMFECVMLGLRKTEGLSLPAFFERFGAGFLTRYAGAVEKLSAMGWLEINAAFARLSARGLDMQNEALLCFMEGES
ncbi:MAG: radical SAM family heme chaperone HemW [Eubacteriales bacterium]|nr:radical SAM family heme chaperone HemW [Eubacteriales bacterium]